MLTGQQPETGPTFLSTAVAGILNRSEAGLIHQGRIHYSVNFVDGQCVTFIAHRKECSDGSYRFYGRLDNVCPSPREEEIEVAMALESQVVSILPTALPDDLDDRFSSFSG